MWNLPENGGVSAKIMRNLSDSCCVLEHEHSLKSPECCVYVDRGWATRSNKQMVKGTTVFDKKYKADNPEDITISDIQSCYFREYLSIDGTPVKGISFLIPVEQGYYILRFRADNSTYNESFYKRVALTFSLQTYSVSYFINELFSFIFYWKLVVYCFVLKTGYYGLISISHYLTAFISSDEAPAEKGDFVNRWINPHVANRRHVISWIWRSEWRMP